MKHEAVEIEESAEERAEREKLDKRRARALALEAKLAKEVEEARLKEPAKAALVRLVGELRTAFGSVRKAVLEQLEVLVLGLKTEELVGDSEVEVKAKEEREKAEKLEKKEEKAEEKAGKW